VIVWLWGPPWCPGKTAWSILDFKSKGISFPFLSFFVPTL
jgi:hypothetical protein